MTKLSKEAAKLHDIYHDYMMMRDVPDMAREDWLEIASAALELAGEKVEFEDVERKFGHVRRYAFGSVNILLRCGFGGGWSIEIPELAIPLKSSAALSFILLHAAATARAWEGEGDNNVRQG